MSALETLPPTIYVFGRRYGDFAARIPQLAGCGAIGATKEEALERAREAARAYLASAPDHAGRLAAWRSLDPSSFPVDDSTDGGFFDHDTAVLAKAELEDLAELFARWSAEIALLTRELAATVTEARRGEEWSVRETRDHLAETQIRWMSRLDALTDGSFRTHELIDAMVRDRIAQIEPASATDRAVLGARWSTRRVVRRLLEHQLEHLGQIRDTLGALARAEDRPSG
jgi:predicted RNase H-like HicB family nuclease